MKAKMWAIKRRETWEITYVIERAEPITEAEAKDLLFMDGLSAAELFDKSWVSDESIDEWETLAVPEGKTFSVSFDDGHNYRLALSDRDEKA